MKRINRRRRRHARQLAQFIEMVKQFDAGYSTRFL